jgi:adenylate cyclase
LVVPDAEPGWIELPDVLTLERLALEAGATQEYIEKLVAAGAIAAGADGLFRIEDVPRVRLTLALAEGGIDLDDLMSMLGSGALQLDWVARLWKVGEPSGRTFAAFAAALGDQAALLTGVYVAFGLAPPMPDTVMRKDEERVIVDFLELWALVEDRPDVYLRAARIAGDGVRRIQAATQDLFDELGGPPGSLRAKGKSPADALRPALRLGPVIAELMVWLQARHQEHEVFERIVAYVEDTLHQAGRGQREGQQPAIAFVDLTGYTELTAASGDERAAESATTLQVLAASAARSRRGRVVKLLGDGVMLRFPSMIEAIDAVHELMAAVAAAGLPEAHSGIAAGPMVVRDGDVYGNVVNLAARVASQAAAGELLITADGADQATRDSFALEDAGSVRLKGITEPVPLLRVPRNDTPPQY